jgi:hypothetical protein
MKNSFTRAKTIPYRAGEADDGEKMREKARQHEWAPELEISRFFP